MLCLANIKVLAKDRFWFLWMTPPGRVQVAVDRDDRRLTLRELPSNDSATAVFRSAVDRST